MLSEEIINKSLQVGITYPTILPIYKSPPDYPNLINWADSQITPMLRNIAHNLVDNINYISFEDFLTQLQTTIQDFNAAIGDAEYILLIAEHRLGKLQKGCSDTWITGLAFEYCDLKDPVEIVTLKTLKQCIKKHSNVKNILILDDAAYSGTQKAEALKEMIYLNLYDNPLQTSQYFKSLNINFAIPFITQYAKNKLLFFGALFNKLSFSSHVEIHSAIDCLNFDEKIYVKNLDVGFLNESHTLTYFDHRFPDFMSGFEPMYFASSLFPVQHTSYFMRLLGYTSRENETNPNYTYLAAEQYNQVAEKMLLPNEFNKQLSYTNIPKIISPYHLHRVQTQGELRVAIENNQMGIRTDFIPEDPNLRAILNDSALENRAPSTQETTSLYDSTKLTLLQQTTFDEAILSNTFKGECINTSEEVNRDEPNQLYTRENNNLFFNAPLNQIVDVARNFCNIL